MAQNESFLMRWSRFFITRYRISIVIIIAIIIAGLWGVTNNQRQDFPTIPINAVFVSTVYPGASPANVEQKLIVPIEQTASSFEEVDYIQSWSRNSFGWVEILLKNADDTEEMTTKISDEVNKLNLPQEAKVEVVDIEAMGPSVAFGLVGTNGQEGDELLQYADEVKARLQTASNEIREIAVSPSNEFQLQIVLDTEELAKNSLNYDAVKGVVQSQLVSLPGGNVKTEEGRIESITVNAPVQSIKDVENISLGRVKLSDIAKIERVPKDTNTIHYVGYVKEGIPYARESVYLMAYKTESGDVINISKALHAEVEEIKKEGILPEDVDIVTGYDIAPFVSDQIESLLNNAFIGLIVILIVLLFFINLRTAITVAFVIPVVFLIGLFVLKVLDYSLNILTLFAMILTLGILVDNAIVIAEGMVHELEKGTTKKDAALTSVKKLGPAVLAATLTTIVAFIPFANIEGIIGDFLKYIPYTIIIIVAASFLVAISITPLIGRWLLKEQTLEQRREKRIKNWERILILPAIVFYGQRAIDWLGVKYRGLMKTIYKKWFLKIVVIMVTTVMLGVSFGYFAPRLEFEQFPSKDGDTIQVDVAFPAGTPFEKQKEVYQKVQDELVLLPYFKTFYSFEGMIWALFEQPVDRADGMTIWEIVDEYDENLEKVRAELDEGIIVTPQAATYGPPLDQFAIVVNFLGTDNETLINAANDLENFLKDKEGIKKIKNGPRESLIPAIDVNLNQEKIAQQAVNSMVAAGTINAIFSPQEIGSIVIREDRVSDEVVVKFSEKSTDSIEDLQNLIIPTSTGGFTRLSDIADVNKVDHPESTARRENKRVATVSVALAEGVDRAKLDAEIKEYLNKDKLKELGLTKGGVSYGGEFVAFESDYSNLQIVFILAMIAVYLILVYQFYSYFQPALIMMAVPLALIGVFPGLLLVDSSLNMISGLGVIALVGIVVNDAIIFIATDNRYRKEHPEDDPSERLVRTGFTRFKPIFSTSITTIGGILPLTIMDPFWTGLGTSIIAGLVFSTAGTLIAIPVLYSVAISVKAKIRRKREAKAMNG